MIKQIVMTIAIITFFTTLIGAVKANEVPYLTTFNKAEVAYKLPNNLLVEVARQESSFDPAIISCKKISHKGAKGIMQIVPKWHKEVDPCNPEEAIFYSAKYLKNLYITTGFWTKALASYYWGLENVQKYEKLPPMVQKYVTDILHRTLSPKLPHKNKQVKSRPSFGTDSLDEFQKVCYSLGMIGYDAVVNKDEGIPLDAALAIAEIENEMSPLLYNVVTQAYQWQYSPHEFSIHVYGWCTALFKDIVRI